MVLYIKGQPDNVNHLRVNWVCLDSKITTKMTTLDMEFTFFGPTLFAQPAFYSNVRLINRKNLTLSEIQGQIWIHLIKVILLYCGAVS